MSVVKDQVIQMVRHLPEDATLDDIMEELYFKMQVDQGLKELDTGQWVSHEEVKKRLARWLSK